MKRTILHIDFDSFFASVAQQDNPLLRGKPVGITATNGRNCIIAASREAKKLGIKSPSRTYDAQRLCPSISFVGADFVRYWEISKKFIAICKDYSPLVEAFSIDELFMDVTETAHLFGGVDRLIATIKHRIKTEVGEYITVSVGIAPNKLLAKMASGLQKPNGIVHITPENLDTMYAHATLTDICGIGYRINERLNRLGVYNLLQLRTVPYASLLAEFGPAEATFLHNVAYGIDTREVISYTIAPTVKSVSRDYCLPGNTYDERVILQNLYELSEEVCIKLRRLHKKARTVGWYIRGSKNIHIRKTYDLYIDRGDQLFGVCLDLLRNQRSSVISRKPFSGDERSQGRFLTTFEMTSEESTRLFGSYARQLSVWAGNLVDAKTVPSSLFPTESKKETVIKIVDTLNDKFGDHTIRNGFLLYADKLTTVPNGFMADKFERMKLAQTSL